MSIPAPSWRQHAPAIPIPRPLQKLFDSVPLFTYEPNELPARAQASISSDIPILYVFSSEEDARRGLPSFNPGCLKWQVRTCFISLRCPGGHFGNYQTNSHCSNTLKTFLKLSKLEFNILPSTNHASPNGSLPFLLPAARDASSSPSPSAGTTLPPAVKPIPSSKLHDYILSHQSKTTSNLPQRPQSPSVPSPRQEAYQSLLDVPLRNAFLYTLYLDPSNSALLEKLYIEPCTSSSLIRATLRHQLRRAAETEILKTTHSVSSGGGADKGLVNPDEIYRLAGEALDALARVLAQTDRWFFDATATQPGLFDVGVFAYTYLMVKFFSSSIQRDRGMSSGEEVQEKEKEANLSLGDMVKRAGNGELIEHMNRILELTWPDLILRD